MKINGTIHKHENTHFQKNIHDFSVQKNHLLTYYV